jgi:hypothetical protein
MLAACYGVGEWVLNLSPGRGTPRDRLVTSWVGFGRPQTYVPTDVDWREPVPVAGPSRRVLCVE